MAAPSADPASLAPSASRPMKQPTKTDFHVEVDDAVIRIFFRPTESHYDYYLLADGGLSRAPILRRAPQVSKTVVKNSISFMSRPRKAMSEWVVHCEVNQRHMRSSHSTREAALKHACSQLFQGHAVNRIVGPNKTITAERVRDWCAKHRP